MINVCREYLPSLAKDARTLYGISEEMKKRSKYKYRTFREDYKDVHYIRNVVSAYLKRVEPTFENSFIITADALGCGVGAILSQKTDMGK